MSLTIPYSRKDDPVSINVSTAFNKFLDGHDKIIIYGTESSQPKHFRVKSWKVSPVKQHRTYGGSNGKSNLGILLYAERVNPNGRQLIISTLLAEIEDRSDNDFSSGKPLRINDDIIMSMMSMNMSSDMNTYTFKFECKTDDPDNY